MLGLGRGGCRVFDLLETALKYGAVVLALLMLVALTLQVFSRYLFNYALSWSEELALLWFAWLIVFSGAVGVRRMTHARMSLVIDHLPPFMQRLMQRFIALLLLGLGFYLAYGGWGYFSETIDSVSPAIGFPIGWLYAAAPVFGVLISLFAMERIITAGQGLDE